MAETTPTVTVRSYVLLVLGSLGYFGFLFVWFILPAFLSPVIAELGISNTAAGVLTGAIPLIYIPLSLTSGLVVDRIGSRRAIGIGLVLLGIAGGVRGWAPGFPSMLALTLLVGVGGTGITFGLPKLVSDLFPPERSGTMSSVYLIGSYLGTAAAFGIGRPYLGPWLGGWREAFLWSGFAVAVFGVVWFLVSARTAGVEHLAGTDEEESFSLGSIKADAVAVIGHRGLRRLVVVGTMYLFVLHGLQAWLATVLEVRGFGASLAATIASVLILARVAGTLTIPPLSDRWSMRRGMIVFCGLLSLVGAAGLLASGSSRLLTIAVVIAAGVGLGGVSPLIRAIPIEMDGIGPKLTGAATGLIFTIGEIGGFSGPFLLGALQDLTGAYESGIALLAAGAVVMILAGASLTGVDD